MVININEINEIVVSRIFLYNLVQYQFNAGLHSQVKHSCV